MREDPTGGRIRLRVRGRQHNCGFLFLSLRASVQEGSTTQQTSYPARSQSARSCQPIAAQENGDELNTQWTRNPFFSALHTADAGPAPRKRDRAARSFLQTLHLKVMSQV